MRRIYRELELGDYSLVQTAIADYAQQKRDYKTNRHVVAPETADRVRRRWAPYFERYRYAGAEAVETTV